VGLVAGLLIAEDQVGLLWGVVYEGEDGPLVTEEAAEDGRVAGVDTDWLFWWLLALLLLLAVFAALAVRVSVFSLKTPPLLLVLAIWALILSRSTSASCDFRSVFLTKPAMIMLQCMSTSSRR
jgi:hypothetical protein